MTEEMINDYSRRIVQSSCVGLTVITLDIAKEYITEALNSEDESFIDGVRNARRCMDTLTSGLDVNVSISRDLLILYLYMKKVLSEQLSKRDDDKLEAVLRMIVKLKTSFSQVESEDSSGPVMKNVQKVYAGLTYGPGSLNETCDNSTNRGYLA